MWYPTAAGPWPLVVFVHGYDVGPATYARFASQLASSGYVVAAPSFPLEDPSRGNGLDRADLVNEATDVSFVISSLSADPAGLHVAPGEVGVAGHSDGADVALEVGYEVGLSDSRVRAVFSDAPDPIDRPVISGGPPLLLMQGTADSVVPYTSSETVFAQVHAPVWYVSLIGADHLPPIAGGTAWTPVLDAAVADFFDSELARRALSGGALTAALSSSPLERVEVNGAA
ncbi:hypothetical protein K6U06_14580 [Acidiferrimicrobium sp. IK]|uniref:alpha/beta hydrolase n=1 Tax=Acidiferrimicrobium sp. IK TaxID=2871700 RepID=UPI0021CB83FD|nr:hypothetical protein [Acidiferrimicrobium sp. IK]MCU4185591.1 hypothetical protein [Acidiferrimicrobium sp. IK]